MTKSSLKILHVGNFGVALGLVFAIYNFVLVIVVGDYSRIFWIFPFIESELNNLGFFGAIINSVSGFVKGFIFGVIFAWIYNRLL